jgi:hypothetical protein
VDEPTSEDLNSGGFLGWFIHDVVACEDLQAYSLRVQKLKAESITVESAMADALVSLTYRHA